MRGGQKITFGSQFCSSQGLNLGCQSWWQAPLPAESSCHPWMSFKALSKKSAQAGTMGGAGWIRWWSASHTSIKTGVPSPAPIINTAACACKPGLESPWSPWPSSLAESTSQGSARDPVSKTKMERNWGRYWPWPLTSIQTGAQVPAQTRTHQIKPG